MDVFKLHAATIRVERPKRKKDRKLLKRANKRIAKAEAAMADLLAHSIYSKD